MREDRRASNGMALLICVECLDEPTIYPQGYPVFLENSARHESLENNQAVTIKDGQALCIYHYQLTRKK